LYCVQLINKRHNILFIGKYENPINEKNINLPLNNIKYIISGKF
jgi:hypothetical protein